MGFFKWFWLLYLGSIGVFFALFGNSALLRRIGIVYVAIFIIVIWIKFRK